MNERLLRSSRDALELWFDAAKWWTGAIVDGSGGRRGTTVAPETGADPAYAFPGRELEADLDGRRIRAKLNSIELYQGGREGGRLELSEVEWDQLRSASVSVVAREVTVSPVTNTLSLAEVEVRGVASLSELVAWADRRTPQWQLGVLQPGSITAVSTTNRKWVTFAPSLDRGELVMELREVGWRGLGARVPRWLRLTRRRALPPLPGGVAILGATSRDDEIQFVLGRPTFSWPVDLRRLAPLDQGLADM